MAVKETKNDFFQCSVLKLIWKLAVPMIVAQVVNALYSIVDRVYIGHMAGVGQLALTGIGLCFPITMTVAAFSALIGYGGAPLSSILRGRKDADGAERVPSPPQQTMWSYRSPSSAAVLVASPRNRVG